MSAWAKFTISHNKYSYMSIAMDEAARSPHKYKHGCIIVKNGKILSKGHNHFKKGKFSTKLSTHAEIDAINKLRDKTLLRGADLYVVRLGSDSNGELIVHNSCPCSTCFPKLVKCMKKYGLHNVFYSTDINS